MLALVASLLLGLPQQSALPTTAPPQNAPAAPQPVPVYGPSHFESDLLQVSWDLPEGVLSREDVAKAINEKFAKKTPTGENCVIMHQMAFDPKVIRRLYVYQYRSACEPSPITPETLRRISMSALKGVLHASGSETMTSPLDYELAGRPAAVVSGNVFSATVKGILFGEMACATAEGDVLCWLFVSGTLPRLGKLAAMPVVFARHSPVPIIPEDLSLAVGLPTITYRNDALHFDFTYPGSFANSKPRADQAIAKKENEMKDRDKANLSCMNVLLSADDFGEDEHSNLLIYSYPTHCGKIQLKASKATMKDFAVGLKKGMSATPGSIAGDPSPYVLASRDAAMIRASLLPTNGRRTHIADACVMLDTDFLCFQLVSTSLDRLRTLAASPVSFNGQQRVPLIPPDLARNIEPLK